MPLLKQFVEVRRATVKATRAKRMVGFVFLLCGGERAILSEIRALSTFFTHRDVGTSADSHYSIHYVTFEHYYNKYY